MFKSQLALKNYKSYIRKLLNRKTYSIISVSEIPDASCASRRTIFSAKKLCLTEPNVITCFNSNAVELRVEELSVPAIELLELKECVFIGGVHSIVAGNFLAVPDCMQIWRDIFRAEICGVANVDMDNNKISISSPKRKHYPVDKAICIFGECSANYAHFMVEILPRLILINQFEKYNHLPLVLDATISDKFIQIIKESGLGSRKIIRVKPYQHIKIRECITLTNVSYISSETRVFFENQILPRPSINDCWFSPDALQVAKEAVNCERSKDSIDLLAPELICLVRYSKNSFNRRNMVNYKEVVKIAKRQGFQIVEPSRMSISKQSKLFSKAKIIISEIGAALINSMFSPVGCKILCFSAVFKNANYYYFSNLAGVLGHDIEFHVGEQLISNERHPLHQDYHVDLNGFNSYLSNLIDELMSD